MYRPVLEPSKRYEALHNSLSRDNYKRMNFTPYKLSSQVISAFTRICTIGLRSGGPLDIYPALFADLARCDDTFSSVLILRTLDIPLSQIQDTLFECSTAKAYNSRIQDVITKDHYTKPSDELVRYYHDQLKSILEGAWELFPNHDEFPVIDAPRIIAYMLHEERPDIYPWPYMTARPAKEEVLASYVQNSLESRTKDQIIEVEVEAVDSVEAEEEVIPVSYTHLTLPTN